MLGRRTKAASATYISAVKDALTAVRTVLKRKPFAKEVSHEKTAPSGFSRRQFLILAASATLGITLSGFRRTA